MALSTLEYKAMDRQPTVTVGFVPRERFSLAKQTLNSILENTEIPFNLMVVDCDTPRKYWRDIESTLADRRNIQIIHSDRYLLPGESRNLVLEQCQDDYVCFVENDCFVAKRWLSHLIQSAQITKSRVVTPLIVESHSWNKSMLQVHHDPFLGAVQTRVCDGRVVRSFTEAPNVRSLRSTALHRVDTLEEHCVLFERSIFEEIGLFDEHLNVNDHVDLLLTLHEHEIPILLDPSVWVRFSPPPPIEPDERPFAEFRWDAERALASYQRLLDKWNVSNLPEGVHFAKTTLRYRSGYLRWWFYRGVKRAFKHDLVERVISDEVDSRR